MALWVDDLLPENERYWDMTPLARAALFELWLYCRRAKNNGIIHEPRLRRSSDAFTDASRAELLRHGWIHEGGKGCATDTCPRGIKGVLVAHDYLQHQESAKNQTARVESRRIRGKKGAHVTNHVRAGRFDEACGYCLERADMSG